MRTSCPCAASLTSPARVATATCSPAANSSASAATLRKLYPQIRRRQRDDERRSLTGPARRLDAPVVPLDDAVHQRQAQPLAAPLVFGGEERVEDLLQVLGRDAAAGV